MVTNNAINNKPDPARTAKSVMIFGASGALSEQALTNGQLLIGNTGNPPSAATLASAGGTITITNGAGSIDLAVATAPVIGASAVLAYLNSAVANATGDGTAATSFDTEVYDIAGNFASSTFTAPTTGKYFAEYGIFITNIGAGHTQGNYYLLTSNGQYYWNYVGMAALRSSANNFSQSGAMVVDMDASDTAKGYVTVSNSTKTVALGTTQAATHISICRFS